MPKGIPKSGKRQNRAATRRVLRPAVVDPNQLYSVEETAAARDKSVSGTWGDIYAGRLKSVRDGARVKVLGAEIIRANREQTPAEFNQDAA